MFQARLFIVLIRIIRNHTSRRGVGKMARCVITKNRNYFDTVKRQGVAVREKLKLTFQLKEKLEGLRIPVGSLPSNSTVESLDAPDDVVIEPPVKQFEVPNLKFLLWIFLSNSFSFVSQTVIFFILM